MMSSVSLKMSIRPPSEALKSDLPMAVYATTGLIHNCNEYSFYKSNRFYLYYNGQISTFLMIAQPDMLTLYFLKEEDFQQEI